MDPKGSARIPQRILSLFTRRSRDPPVAPGGSYDFGHGGYRNRSDSPLDPKGSSRISQQILVATSGSYDLHRIRSDSPMAPITFCRVPFAYLMDPITFHMMRSDPPTDPIVPDTWKQDPIRK